MVDDCIAKQAQKHAALRSSKGGVSIQLNCAVVRILLESDARFESHLSGIDNGLRDINHPTTRGLVVDDAVVFKRCALHVFEVDCRSLR